MPFSVADHLNQTSFWVGPQPRKVPAQSASVTAGNAVTVAVAVLNALATPETSVGAVAHSSCAKANGHARSCAATQLIKVDFFMSGFILVKRAS